MSSKRFSLLSIVALSGACLIACSDSSTPSSSSGSTMDGGSSGSSGGPGTLSLYERLGGKSGLEGFVKSVVETKILTDADLKTFFFNQVPPIPAGHPSATQIVVCFARFVGSALGQDTYPGAPVNDPMNTNTPNHTCRDMVSAHRVAGTQLAIGDGNFDKFIGMIATSLMPLVKPTATKAGKITQAEFDPRAGALNGQKTSVTTAGAPSTGAFKAP